MVTSEFRGKKMWARFKNDETNLQQIQGIAYFCIQALHDHAPTDICTQVGKTRAREIFVFVFDPF